MILEKGEKIHVIHRRYLEKEPQRHFAGIVDAYEDGIARVTGYIFAVDPVKAVFFRRPELRTRFISLQSGDALVNILPPTVDLEKIVYKQENKSVRVTDGGEWHMDISEFAWR
jgi:hypothetical protein